MFLDCFMFPLQKEEWETLYVMESWSSWGGRSPGRCYTAVQLRAVWVLVLSSDLVALDFGPENLQQWGSQWCCLIIFKTEEKNFIYLVIVCLHFRKMKNWKLACILFVRNLCIGCNWMFINDHVTSLALHRSVTLEDQHPSFMRPRWMRSLMFGNQRRWAVSVVQLI